MGGKAATWFKRYVMLFYGVTFMAFGVALMYYSELGSAPVAVFNEGLHISFGISVGTANILVSVAMILLAYIIDRRFVSVATYAMTFGTGLLIDLFMTIIGYFFPEVIGFPMQLFCLVISTLIIGLGVGIVISANAGVAAFEAFALPLCEKIHFPYKYFCIVVNALFAGGGWLLGGKVGLCTVVFGLFSGFVIDYTTKLSSATFAKKLGLEGADIY